MSNAMKAWTAKASVAQQRELAERVGTSHAYLFKLGAKENAEFRRTPKVELAAAIERVSGEMHRETKGALPRILRVDLQPTCRGCPYAARALGQAAVVAAEFPFVSPCDSEGGHPD